MHLGRKTVRLACSWLVLPQIVCLWACCLQANSGWNEVEGGPLGDFADLHNYVPRQSSHKNQCFNHRGKTGLHQDTLACSRRPACDVKIFRPEEDNSSIFGPLAMSFQNFAAWGYTVGGRHPVLQSTTLQGLNVSQAQQHIACLLPAMQTAQASMT